MKKKLFTILFATSLLSLGLMSCTSTPVDDDTNNNDNNNDNNNNDNNDDGTIDTPSEDPCTVKILPVEHAIVTSSIMSGEVGEEGYLTITPESKDYRVNEVVQNDLFKLYEDESVKYRYPFTLKEGENTFLITMYYEEVIESDSDIIGPTNEEIVPDGELSDELDPIPTPGEDKPAFENPVRLYFKDSSWWNQSAAGVGVISYDENGNIISSNTTLGDQMTHMNYNAAGGFNYFYIDIDGDNAESIQFIRTDGNCTSFWGAKTEILDVPEEPNDMYILTDVESWYGDSEPHTLATCTVGKYDPTNDPVIENNGIYTLYFETKDWWDELSGEVYCYIWGTSPKTAWPGEAMTKVSDTLYSIEFDTSLYMNCIFAKVNGSTVTYQTADIKVPTTYGENASIIARLNSDTKVDKDSVTWSAYEE